MATDFDKLNYISSNVIDKIVIEDAVTTPLEYIVAGGGTTTTQTVTNTYGTAGFVTLSWSIDGVNYYPAQAYTDATAPYTANGWCDAASIYIYMENYSGAGVTFRIKFTLDTVN